MRQRLRHYRSNQDLKECGVCEDGRYRSQWYQGLKDGMEWLRLSLTLEGVENAAVCVYASDERPGVWEDGAQKPVMERRAADLLLYGVRGRYVCFTVAPADKLRSYELSFPGYSIDMGLPLAMQGDDTLRRFLGVYQSLYMDLNRDFAEFPDRLNPLGQDPLSSLASWIGAMRWMRRTSDKFRQKLLAAAPGLNQIRGTRRGIEQLLELTTGGSAKLIEQFQWEQTIVDAKERDDCAQLYGADSPCVTILLPVGTSKEVICFLRDILKDFLPIGIRYMLIPLEDGAPMDDYCYLDENAQLTELPPPVLDEVNLEDLILE